MFDSYYCNTTQQARPIGELIECFERQGNIGLDIAHTEEIEFDAEEWKSWDERRRSEVLMNYRIAYLAETAVSARRRYQELGVGEDDLVRPLKGGRTGVN